MNSPDSGTKKQKKLENNFFEAAREKAELLLLPSQVEIMKDVFERTDKYKDYILKRSDFLMALRTDDLVVDFVDADAIRCRDPKRTVLTLDQVLVEIERDEMYEQNS